jgi:hypothetical protein
MYLTWGLFNRASTHDCSRTLACELQCSPWLRSLLLLNRPLYTTSSSVRPLTLKCTLCPLFVSLFMVLLFYVPLKNFSLLWKRHRYRWRAAKFGLWAGRDLYCATFAVTRDLSFSSLIRRTAPFSCLLQHTRGCGGPILTSRVYVLSELLTCTWCPLSVLCSPLICSSCCSPTTQWYSIVMKCQIHKCVSLKQRVVIPRTIRKRRNFIMTLIKDLKLQSYSLFYWTTYDCDHILNWL